MKIFRSIGFSLAMACMGLAAYVCDSLYSITKPMLRYLSIGFDAMACGVEKLKRELVQVFNTDDMVKTGVGCGLTAEGNGYRQISASMVRSRMPTPI